MIKNKQGVCRVRADGIGGEEKDMKSGGNKTLCYGESVDLCMSLVFTLAGIGSLGQLFISFLLMLNASFKTLVYDAGSGTL